VGIVGEKLKYRRKYRRKRRNVRRKRNIKPMKARNLKEGI